MTAVFYFSLFFINQFGLLCSFSLNPAVCIYSGIFRNNPFPRAAVIAMEIICGRYCDSDASGEANLSVISTLSDDTHATAWNCFDFKNRISQ
jgi:hypothetical protein